MDALRAEIASKRKALPEAEARPTKYMRKGDLQRLQEEREARERDDKAAAAAAAATASVATAAEANTAVSAPTEVSVLLSAATSGADA
jgi:pre-mRNA-splicing factor 18